MLLYGSGNTWKLFYTHNTRLCAKFQYILLRVSHSWHFKLHTLEVFFFWPQSQLFRGRFICHSSQLPWKFSKPEELYAQSQGTLRPDNAPLTLSNTGNHKCSLLSYLTKYFFFQIYWAWNDTKISDEVWIGKCAHRLISSRVGRAHVWCIISVK